MQGLTPLEIKKIKDHLDTAKKPLFFFDDDADGVSSFLLLYRYLREGKGVIIKSRPALDKKFLCNIEEYGPDTIFVLDIAIIEDEFVNAVKEPIVWIDHHTVQEKRGMNYFNPRKHNESITYPTSHLCYDVVQSDLWIAMCGCVGDWMLPSFTAEFCEKYPDLLSKDVTFAPVALFDTELGKLIRILNFNLKGTTSNAMKSVKILTRIETPYEILRQETNQGKYLYQQYEKVNIVYEALLRQAEKKATDKDPIFLFEYRESSMSFTSDLSNELLYRHPEKLIIIAREKSGEMRMSVRSSKEILPPIIEKSLEGLEGYGGGHEHACCCCVKKEQFKEFLSRLRMLIQTYK